jgi:integrase
MAASRAALIETADGGDGFVFRNRRGEPRLPRNIARAFRSVVSEAGLRETEDGKVTFHSLRHTGISRLANAPDVALVYVRDFAGHTSLATTETSFIGSSRMRRPPPPSERWLARRWHVKPGTGRTERECAPTYFA